MTNLKIKNELLNSFRVYIFIILALVVFKSYNAKAQTWQQCAPIPEKMIPGIAVVDGKIYATSSGIMYKYDPISDTWTKKGKITSIGASLVEVDGRIFAIGGRTSGGVSLKTVVEYDSATGNWNNRTNSSKTVDDAGILSYQGKIYVFGGTDNSAGTAMNDLQVYDPKNDSWELKTQMKKPRIGPDVVVLNGKFYAICGWTANYALSEGLEEYDISTDTWTERADYAATPGQYLSRAIVINGKIYSVLTLNRIPTKTFISEYDPATNIWTIKINSLSPVSYPTKLLANNKLYVFGGFTSSGMTSRVIEYDPETNTIFTLPNLAQPKVECRAVEIDGKIFVLGGTLDWSGTNYNTVEVYDPKTSGISNHPDVSPSAYSIYPNRFHLSTNISFIISKQGMTTLKIFNSDGKLVDVIVNQDLSPGDYKINWTPKQLQSGIYFCQLKIYNYTETKKMIYNK